MYVKRWPVMNLEIFLSCQLQSVEDSHSWWWVIVTASRGLLWIYASDFVYIHFLRLSLYCMQYLSVIHCHCTACSTSLLFSFWSSSSCVLTNKLEKKVSYVCVCVCVCDVHACSLCVRDRGREETEAETDVPTRP